MKRKSMIKTLKKMYKKNKKGLNKKTRKLNTRYKKGGAEENCCMCNKVINGKPFIPSGCLMKHGKISSHKICSDCWWNKFAQEGVSHQCPGCLNGLPLNKPKPFIGKSKTEVIDLTEE